MPFLLCCQASFLLMGIALLSFGPRDLWGRRLAGGRLVLIGVLLIIQAPLALGLGGLALGDTTPRPLDGASLGEARDILLATLTEWGVTLLVVGIIIWAFFTAPSVETESDEMKAEEN